MIKQAYFRGLMKVADINSKAKAAASAARQSMPGLVGANMKPQPSRPGNGFQASRKYMSDLKSQLLRGAVVVPPLCQPREIANRLRMQTKPTAIDVPPKYPRP